MPTEKVIPAKPGFNRGSLRVETHDGLNVILLESLIYHARNGESFTIPLGTTSDGPSIPLWAQLFIRATVCWLPGVFHDGLYRILRLPRAQCDALLLESMQVMGIPAMDAEIIFHVVRLFGAHAYRADGRLRDRLNHVRFAFQLIKIKHKHRQKI